MLHEEVTTKLPTNDLFKTSTGVGHHYRPGYYFPDSSYEAQLTKPVPRDIAKFDEVLPKSHFLTTNQEYHDIKIPNEAHRADIVYQKAPALNNVTFNKDLREKLGKGGWRRSLSPRNQLTETQEEFSHKAQLSEPLRWKSFQPFNLYDHHREGPSKQIIPSTQNPKMAGRVIYPKDLELLRELDPYVTTNNKYHRVWNPDEWQGVAKKDVTTYWDTQDVPKVHGFGMKHNPIPKTTGISAPPMRDTVLPFERERKVRHVPPLNFVVPHSAYKSEYSNTFVPQGSEKSKEWHSHCVDIPFHLPAPGPRSAMVVRGMYQTEYSNIGKEETIVM